MEIANWILTRVLAMDGLWIPAVAAFAVLVVYALYCAVRGSGACTTFLNDQEEEGEWRHV